MSHPTLQSRGNADTAVVLLTGADRLSLDSVAFSLADSYASVCAISYDVRPNDEAAVSYTHLTLPTTSRV